MEPSMPEMRLRLFSGNHEADLTVQPRLRLKDKKVIIEIQVGWPSTTYKSASDAAAAAALHTLIAQKAMLAESVAHGREWGADDVY